MSGVDGTARTGTRSRRGWLPWLVLAVVVAAVVGWAAWPSGTPSAAERARALAREIRCPDCESLSAADSHTAAARAIRRDLRERIAEGQSDETIRRAYVERYGDSILLEPERDGLGLVVWLVPVLVVVGGAAGLVVVFRRWRVTQPLRATEADEELVREVRGREATRGGTS